MFDHCEIVDELRCSDSFWGMIEVRIYYGLSLKVTYAALRDGPRWLGIAFKVSHGRWTNGGVIRPSFGTNK